MSAAGLFIVGVLVTLVVAVALSLLLYAAILDGREAGTRGGEPVPAPVGGSRTLLETARRAGEFTTLMRAVDKAGLSELLAGREPYTIFAPSDRAFARLPDGVVDALLAAPDTLADVVGYHVVPGRLTTAEAGRRASAETFQGEALAISGNGQVRVDGAHVVQGDIEASNGVIHVIDRVLLPARL